MDIIEKMGARSCRQLSRIKIWIDNQGTVYRGKYTKWKKKNKRQKLKTPVKWSRDHESSRNVHKPNQYQSIFKFMKITYSHKTERGCP